MFDCGAGDAIRMTQRMERQAAADLGDLPSRGPACGASVRRGAGGRRRRATDRRSRVADGDAFWAWRSRADGCLFRAARAAGAPLWRLSVKASAPYADLGGEQMIEWSGALRWLVAGERTDPARVRAWAAAHGGHATLFRAADKSAGAFHPLPRDPARAASPAEGDVRSRGHPESRPAVSGLLGCDELPREGADRADRARRFHPRYARGPRSRRDPARVRALRLLHGDVPDLSAARRRAGRPARAHLSHQGDARGRRGHRERRASISIAASRAAAARRRALRASNTVGWSTSAGTSSTSARPGHVAARAGRWLVREALLSRGLFAFALAIGRMAKAGAAGERCARRSPTARPAGRVARRRGTARKMLALDACVQGALAPGIDAALARVLDRIGISLLRVSAGGCCGALAAPSERRGAGARDRQAQHRRRGGRTSIATSRRSSSPRAAAA